MGNSDLKTQKRARLTLFDLAMKMELDGRAYYEELDRQTDLPGLQAIFRALARDEQKHYALVCAMKEQVSLPTLAESTSLAIARHVFAQLPLPDVALKNIKSILEAYQHVMDVEAESQRLYEDAAAKETDPQLRQVLVQIAAEEKQHFVIMENVYQFINAPNHYLAGAESRHREPM